MDRRKFVKTTVAAGVAASFPLLTACGEKTRVATEADTSIRAISLDGAEMELTKAMVRELGEAMNGPVMLSGDPGYDTARKIWNGMHDKHPALIARCLSTDDVVQAVNFARDHGSPPFVAAATAGPASPSATTAS